MREARQTRRLLNNLWKRLRKINKKYNSYTTRADNRRCMEHCIRATHTSKFHSLG